MTSERKRTRRRKDELGKLISVELKSTFTNRRVLASLLALPVAIMLIMVVISYTSASASAKPVRVCVPATMMTDSQFLGAITSAGGTVVTNGNCEVSFARNNTVYYSINIYENLNHVRKMEKLVNSVVTNYYLMKHGAPNGVRVIHKTILVIDHRVELLSLSPSETLNGIMFIAMILPIVLFTTLLVGNEYVGTSLTTQRDRKIFELISTYPVKRRNIILSKLSVALVFGLVSIILLVLSMIIATLITIAVLHGYTHGVTTGSSVASPSAQSGGFVIPSVGGLTIALIIANAFLVVIFTFLVTLIVSFKTRDPTESSIMGVIVTGVLDGSLMIPVVMNSLSIVKGYVVPLLVPTLIPIKVAALGVTGQSTLGLLYTLYNVSIVYLAYKFLLRTYENSFE